MGLNKNILRKMNKKAIIFTFMSILLVSLFSLIFLAKYDAPIDRKNELINTRVRSLNEFVENYDIYAENILNLVSTKAIEGLIEYIETNNTYLYNFEQDFNECALNGTVSVGLDDCPGMENNTLGEWLDRIEQTAEEEFFIDLEYSYDNLSINQTYYKHLDVEFDITYTITDKYANWQATKTITTEVPITGFKDPIYVMDARVNKTIDFNNKGNLGNNRTLIEEFINKSQYRQSSNSPSFLMRLHGNMEESEYGMFSLVSPNNFINKDNTSYVDFLFLNNIEFDCNDVYRINGLAIPYNEVKIDTDHLRDLNINISWLSITC